MIAPDRAEHFIAGGGSFVGFCFNSVSRPRPPSRRCFCVGACVSAGEECNVDWRETQTTPSSSCFRTYCQFHIVPLQRLPFNAFIHPHLGRIDKQLHSSSWVSSFSAWKIINRLPNLHDRSGEFCVYKLVASPLSRPKICNKCRNLSQPFTVVRIIKSRNVIKILAAYLMKDLGGKRQFGECQASDPNWR